MLAPQLSKNLQTDSITAMASIRDLRRLFEAISNKDWEAARSRAEHLASLEAKRGNQAAARMLRDSLRATNGTTRGEASLLDVGLSRGMNKVRLADVALSPQLRGELLSIMGEYRHSTSLESRGFSVRRKLIFTGPPGCGKSLTAQAIANELKLPHFVVRFDAIIGSFLGQTATHLRQIFKFSESSHSLLLFDEIDALGKRRGNPMDVGELDRIVIALMQELELSHPQGLLIATSNIPEHLDRALWRRFDAQLVFPAPKRAELKDFAINTAKRFGRELPKPIVTIASRKRSYAECEDAVSSYLPQEIMTELTNKNGRPK